MSPVFLNDGVGNFLQAWPSPQKPDVMDKVRVKGHGHPIAFLSLCSKAVDLPSAELPVSS